MSPKRRKEGHERHREDSPLQDRTQTPEIGSSLALLSADRLLSFEDRLKASHGIRDRRTSKGKARFQSLLGKGSGPLLVVPISWMKANVFYWNRGMRRSIQFFCHLEIV